MDKTHGQTLSTPIRMPTAISKATPSLAQVCLPITQSNLHGLKRLLELNQSQLDGTSYVAKKLLNVSQFLSGKLDEKGIVKEVRPKISEVEPPSTKRIRVDLQKAILKCSKLSEEFTFKAK